MTPAAHDPVTLTVTMLRNDPLAIQVANSVSPKGTWIPRSLIIDITREAEDGTVSLTIARALAQTRGLM